jgi:hypothetical protein
MTKDDIIKLMQQACDPDKKPAWHNEFWTITQEELERFADLVAKAERTAFADLVSGYLTSSKKPRQRLTDEEIDRITDQQWATNNHKPIYAAHRAYARAIERAHGIGEKE